jgi:LexA-binding, inner membrane-associated putative hydrolase
MMGRHHVMVGGALGLGAAIALQQGAGRSLGLNFTPEQLAAIALIVAPGSALLVDLDEPNATAARTLGPVSQLVCKGISRLTGGHRGHKPHRPSTHDALSWFTVLMVALAALAIRSPAGYMTVLALCAIWEFRLLGPPSLRAHWHIGCIFAGVGTGVAIGLLVPVGGYVPLGVAIGCVAHLLADLPSDSGLPIFNLISSKRLRLDWFHTGRPAETIVTWLTLLGALVLAWAHLPELFAYAATIFVGMALVSDADAQRRARARRRYALR